MCLHIKVAELNTLSDGKGITGIHIVYFLNEMGNKKKKKSNANLRHF